MSSCRSQWNCATLLASLAIAGLLPAGCKTQDDAVAAAAQMASTAKTMCAYYAALDHVLAGTEDAYEAQYALLQTPPEDLKETRKELQMRADLATQIGNLATLFQKMTGQEAEASDASAAKKSTEKSSGKSEGGAVAAIAGAAAGDGSAGGSAGSSTGSSGGAGSSDSGKSKSQQPAVLSMLSSDSDQYKAVSAAIDEVVMLVREHDETKAAKKMSPLCDSLTAFFDLEKGTYDSINQAYLVTAKSVADYMVNNNQVDPSAVFVSSLQPFGLSAAISREQIRTNLQQYLLGQIDTQYAVKLKAAQEATVAMDQALEEMDKRVKLVAEDKPMTIRIPPFSLATVESWIAVVGK